MRGVKENDLGHCVAPASPPSRGLKGLPQVVRDLPPTHVAPASPPSRGLKAWQDERRAVKRGGCTGIPAFEGTERTRGFRTWPWSAGVAPASPPSRGLKERDTLQWHLSEKRVSEAPLGKAQQASG